MTNQDKALARRLAREFWRRKDTGASAYTWAVRDIADDCNCSLSTARKYLRALDPRDDAEFLKEEP